MRQSATTAESLERRTTIAGGVERTYLVANDPGPHAPLVVALHGLGMNAQ
jgi:hypothetical protein